MTIFNELRNEIRSLQHALKDAHTLLIAVPHLDNPSSLATAYMECANRLVAAADHANELLEDAEQRLILALSDPHDGEPLQ